MIPSYTRRYQQPGRKTDGSVACTEICVGIFYRCHLNGTSFASTDRKFYFFSVKKQNTNPPTKNQAHVLLR